jgi:hypothetical protein
MKRVYRDRPVSLEDVMRKYIAQLPLDQQLKASLEYEARKQSIAVNKQRGVEES